MKHQILSFLGACALILGVFIVVKSLRVQDGQAMASSANVAVKSIEDGARLSSAEKRRIRHVMMKDGGIETLNGRDVRAVLKQPELVRMDLPTVVWQYRNDFCVLDVYFTASSPKVLKSPVVHYEVRARQNDVADEEVSGVCVEKLVREKAAGQNFVNLDAFYKSY